VLFFFFLTYCTMARQHSTGLGVQRYLGRRKNSLTARTRTPWRHRIKAKYYTPTPAEKATRKAERRARKELRAKAFDSASAAVMQEAVRLHETLGSATVTQCYEELCQRSQLKTKRAKSRWNAYLRQEVKKINDGVVFSYLGI
jgi:hypothetical protein